jgi:hypothetical protein
MPNLPLQTWSKHPSESRQSSANSVSKCWLKVSWGVLHSLEFMTEYILLSLDPFGTESDREHERVPISLTRSLMLIMLDILSSEMLAEHDRNA